MVGKKGSVWTWIFGLVILGIVILILIGVASFSLKCGDQTGFNALVQTIQTLGKCGG